MMSAAFHPETNSQTERINYVIEAYLRIFFIFEQNDWIDVLSMGEYTYNDSKDKDTGFTLFFTSFNFHPRSNLPVDIPRRNPVSQIFVDWMDLIHNFFRNHLTMTASQIGNYHDPKQFEVLKWKADDKVWQDARYIKSKLASQKLEWQMYEHFELIKMLWKNAGQLKLPDT